MNKTEFVNKIFSMADLPSKTKAEEVVNAFLESVQEAIATGDSVNFVGFGSFKMKEKSARKCRNPRTGEMIDVPACKTVKFVAGKNLNDALK